MSVTRKTMTVDNFLVDGIHEYEIREIVYIDTVRFERILQLYHGVFGKDWSWENVDSCINAWALNGGESIEYKDSLSDYFGRNVSSVHCVGTFDPGVIIIFSRDGEDY